MWKKLFDDFCQERLYLKNCSPLTIRSYKQAWDRFSRSGTGEVSKASLNAFVVSMRKAGLSPVSCNISIRAMNSFLAWLNENDHQPERLKIPQLKVEKKVIKPYTDEELSRILAYKARSFSGQRLLALIATLIDTGIRIDEALGIERSKVDFDNLLITVRGKGNKQRVIPISQECRRILYKFLMKHNHGLLFASRRGDKANYRSILKQWQRLCDRLGVEYRGFHSLRHNFGLNFIKQGGDVSELQRLLGHSSISTTTIYLNFQTADLQRAHAKTSILSRLRH